MRKISFRSLIVFALALSIFHTALAARVIERLEREDIPVEGSYGGFGAIEEIKLWRPDEYPPWLIATTGTTSRSGPTALD